ncbi:MAG: hypothetical protein LBO67_04765 [Spirochaetaceae bacterium]|jgi:hypothetical protein|nr:hypothetical protein [Spirochaetaceae bacterium]
MELYGEPKRAIAGMKYGLKDNTETFIAGEKIYPGDPCFGMVGDEHTIYGAYINAVTLTASVDLVTGNEIAVTINGIVLAPVEFVTSSVTTLEALVQAINLNADIGNLGIEAFIVEGANALTLEGPGITITASAVVTGGASQATFVSAATTNMKFVGVARHTELCFKEGTGFYPPKTTVNVQTEHEIYVPVADGSSPADKKPAFIILSGDDVGKFTDEEDGTYESGALFRSAAQDGLARVELRGMK